ncbi:MAG: dephospho-CoA kinase [Sphingobacteriales bacterium]|nr:dephospho-CoA kinase [Sphingobacteriales bacterium]
MALKIGLTGGIGSGKSVVAKVFETLGIPVYYADDAARKLMNADEELKKSIIKNFGEESYKNGELDRKYLSSIVFNSKEQLELLNSLTHPATIADAGAWIKKQNAPYIIKEAALLFESGADKNLDYVIGISSPLPLRIKRVMQRDGLTEKEVMQRISRQMDEQEKMKMCDYVIVNNEQQLVLPQVIELHKKFTAIPILS